jgi:hypothetical protein
MLLESRIGHILSGVQEFAMEPMGTWTRIRFFDSSMNLPLRLAHPLVFGFAHTVFILSPYKRKARNKPIDNRMQFKEWLLQEKFMNDKSYWCGYCRSPLKAVEMQVNPHHIYEIGQLRSCQCGKSRVWTNSLRNPERFLMWLDGQIPYYTNGFCNDQFCDYCQQRHVIALKNGVPSPISRHPADFDLYGCPACAQNQNILGDAFLEDKENQTDGLKDWYKFRRTDIEALVASLK